MQILSTLPTTISETFAGKELHYNIAKVCKSIGGKHIIYDFAFNAGYNNIFHNAHGLIRLMIDVKEGDGSIDINENIPVYVDAILFDHHFKNAGIKFRKINAKTLDEAGKKIAKWFADNADKMNSVEF